MIWQSQNMYIYTWNELNYPFYESSNGLFGLQSAGMGFSFKEKRFDTTPSYVFFGMLARVVDGKIINCEMKYFKVFSTNTPLFMKPMKL